MGYRYETHLHTKEASACARTWAKDYISFYKERGYSGIIVTDHFFSGNTGVDRNQSWHDWVSEYCKGYEHAKEEGDKQEFTVFFGIEQNFDGDEYLVYGLTREWLLAHPEMLHCSRKEFYELMHQAGALVVQAHPYRERGYLRRVNLNPYYVDAWEVVNFGNEPYQDALAIKEAKKRGLPVIGGSDMHCIDGDPATGGIESDTPLSSVQDFMELIKRGKGYSVITEKNREALADSEAALNTHLPVWVYEKDGTMNPIP